MVNILITGGAGFIGSSLANKLLLNKRYRIVVVDNLETGLLSNLKIKKKIFIKLMLIILNPFQKFLQNINLTMYFILQHW